MEPKDEPKMLCCGCLCVGKTLHRITNDEMQRFYLDALREIPLCNPVAVCPALCCECTAILRKAVSFRELVKDSYRILQTYTNEDLEEHILTDIARPPRLKLHSNIPVSVTPMDDLTTDCHIQDALKHEDGVDVQRVFVKEEVKHEWREIDDDRPLSELSEDILSKETEKPTTGKKGEKNRNNSIQPKSKEKKTKKTIKRLKTEKPKREVKKTKKIIKRLKTAKEATKPLENDVDEPQILTIELSYDEMLLEREKDSKREGYVKAEYKCDTCLIGFSYSKSYKAHMEAKHSPEIGKYICPVCKTVMAAMESYTSHYKRHMRRYECSVCSKRTMDLKVMRQHYYSAHNVPLKYYQCKCNICGKVSDSIDKHRYHRDQHKARVQCMECDKTFSHRAGLMNHRLAVHEYHNDFPCSVCNKVFRWKSSLKRHFETHQTEVTSADPVAQCSLCGVGFSSHSSYQRHLRNSLRHVAPSQLRFTCDDCGRRFADKTKLRDHIEEKHLHRTYQCHICSKPSKNRVGLDQHIRNVHRRRPNNKMCHHCGKGFPTKVQLESHIRTHTGERPFICEFCPTTFSHQSNLYKHNRQVHLNIKSKRYPLKKTKVKDEDQTRVPSTELVPSQTTALSCTKSVVMVNYSQEHRVLYKFCE